MVQCVHTNIQTERHTHMIKNILSINPYVIITALDFSNTVRHVTLL